MWVPELHQIDLSAAGIETKITVPLGSLDDGRMVWLQGTPDLWTMGTVYDWKTTGNPWKENGGGLTRGSFGQQAPLYLHLVSTLGATATRFVFYVYDRGSGAWASHETVWSPASIGAALANAWEYGKMIGAGAFPYTPASDNYGKYQRGWHCSARYCGAWDICEGKRILADGADMDMKIDSHW